MDFSHFLDSDFTLICNRPISITSIQPGSSSSEQNSECNEKAGAQREEAFYHSGNELLDTVVALLACAASSRLVQSSRLNERRIGAESPHVKTLLSHL